MPMRAPVPTPIGAWRDIVTDALRAWRSARDCGASSLTRLHGLLAPRGHDMVAPALDSLLLLLEAALGRPLIAGRPHAPSRDEDMLCGLLAGTTRRGACISCPEGAGTALDCAICSARIMLTLGRG